MGKGSQMSHSTWGNKFKPLFLDNSGALDLCAATLPLALGRGADAWEKYQHKCDYVGVSAWVSLTAQPGQPRSVSRAKMAVGKKSQLSGVPCSAVCPQPWEKQ